MSSISERTSLLKHDSKDEINKLYAFQREIHIEGATDELYSSPVRRTFCIIVLFDLIICCLLWILYLQFKNTQTAFQNYEEEVGNWTFNSSLFDNTILAGTRFVYLEITYGCVKSNYPWFLAVSTTCTSVYAIVKAIFLSVSNSNGIGIIVIIISFVISWTETIFLIYRVLPKEKAAANVAAYYRYLSEQYSNHSRTNNNSLLNTIPDNDELSFNSLSDNEEFFSPQQTRAASPTKFVNKEIIQLCKILRENAGVVCENTKDWKYITGDAVNGFITSKSLPAYTGKLYKIECFFNIDPEVLFKELVFNVEKTPTWNPQVRHVERVETISNNIDIVYNVSNDALKGYIAARDFVLVRVWGNMEQKFFLYMKSYDHASFPSLPNIIRGDTGLSAVVLEKSSIGNNQTKLIWIMNNDLKGNRMFQTLVDKAMPKIMHDLIINIRNHCHKLNSIV